jgi:hypothetical protein
MGQAERLYELLPAVYRERDAERGYPLRALLRIVGAQAVLVEQDIAQLWDDLFIETCRPWVIPYIGDLVANRLLFDAGRLPEGGRAEEVLTDLAGPDLRPPIAIRTRADVAKTIYYRRRKGTLPMLEELARDVTGWPVHAVEMFELLGWTQHLEHLRVQSQWVDVRSVDRMDRVDGPFDETSHTVDVRRIAQQEGWHHVPNVAFFAYRLGAYELSRVPARVGSESWRYHFSPLGNPAPLFSRWRREGDESGLATELHVPAPIRRAFFYEDLRRYRSASPPRPDFTDLYGLPDPDPALGVGVAPEASFFIVRNGVAVVPTANPSAPPPVYSPELVCRQLDPWPAAQPSGRIVAVDPHSGRMAIGDGWGDPTASVDVYYHYGFPADLGGGPYERSKWEIRPEVASVRLVVQEGVAPGPDRFPDLLQAVQAWVARGRPSAVISVLDSRRYALPALIALPNDGFLAIEAANGARPLLQTEAAGLEIGVLAPASPSDPTREATLTLSGVLVEGYLHVTGDLGRLRLIHATVVPGRNLTESGQGATVEPGIVAEGGAAGALLNTELRVEIAFSVVGALAVPEHGRGVLVLDSIVDALEAGRPAYGDGAGGAGPDLELERSTLIGGVACRTLRMSESIATGRIDTVRTQEGCVRFSYVRPGSRTPRRFRCQPELAVAAAVEVALSHDPTLTAIERQQIRSAVEARVVPSFTTAQYGQPAYVQLRAGAPVEIRTGAEDGSEMGAYSHVKQPQRLDNLRLRLEEYLPFGLDAGTLFVT